MGGLGVMRRQNVRGVDWVLFAPYVSSYLRMFDASAVWRGMSVNVRRTYVASIPWPYFRLVCSTLDENILINGYQSIDVCGALLSKTLLVCLNCSHTHCELNSCNSLLQFILFGYLQVRCCSAHTELCCSCGNLVE